MYKSETWGNGGLAQLRVVVLEKYNGFLDFSQTLTNLWETFGTSMGHAWIVDGLLLL
ncbi:hypothetical protein KI659_17305 [Litoribacter alkaliphilus]|uniref:Uncharacterized protein n=1 Tax=Litoribacter ruber TaxID=702568 RepID=A0AAP2CJA8_9BACT|nr:hypothetical protein [Litoribacter alkaliphilus]MBS9525781.1 hypothetical protein [Litoribacter alkaliphilus]